MIFLPILLKILVMLILYEDVNLALNEVWPQRSLKVFFFKFCGKVLLFITDFDKKKKKLSECDL